MYGTIIGVINGETMSLDYSSGGDFPKKENTNIDPIILEPSISTPQKVPLISGNPHISAWRTPSRAASPSILNFDFANPLSTEDATLHPYIPITRPLSPTAYDLNST